MTAHLLEAARIKDLLRVLRWCENVRVAGFPDFAATVSLKEAPARIDVPNAAAEGWPAFIRLVLLVTKRKTNWPAEFKLVRTCYEPHLKRIYDDAELRAADLIVLIPWSSSKRTAAATSGIWRIQCEFGQNLSRDG